MLVKPIYKYIIYKKESNEKPICVRVDTSQKQAYLSWYQLCLLPREIVLIKAFLMTIYIYADC